MSTVEESVLALYTQAQTLAAVKDNLAAYKYLVANYLEDGPSVSSIPANFRAYKDRHQTWLSNFESKITSTAPDWTTIRNFPSYQTFFDNVAEFKTSVNDPTLTNISSTFSSDLVQLEDEAIFIRNALLNEQPQNLLTPQAYLDLGAEGAALQQSVLEAVETLNEYIGTIGASRRAVVAFSNRRRQLIVDLSETWNRLAQLQIQKYAQAEFSKTVTVIDQRNNERYIQNRLNLDLDSYPNKMNSAILIELAPYKYAALWMESLEVIAEIEAFVDKEDFAPEVHQAFKNQIVVRRKAYLDSKMEVDRHFKARGFLAKERKRRVEQVYLSKKDSLSPGCNLLAEAILAASEAQEVRAFHERQFSKFNEKCE